MTFAPMLVDSHCHIYLPEFNDDFDAMVQRASQNGVRIFFLPNVDTGTISDLHRITDRLSDRVYPMMGLHPCSVKEDMEKQLAIVEEHLFKPVRKYWAVGEIGLDLYWDKTTLDRQIIAFETQIHWAKVLNIPIAIHVREAFEQCFAVVDKLHSDRLRGVFHCFSGSEDDARHIVDYRTFKMGIGGVVTFKNGGIDTFLKDIDISYIILETDAPYLAPVPHRGKRNEPAYIKLVAEKLGVVYGISVEEVARITTDNCAELFGVEFPSESGLIDF